MEVVALVDLDVLVWLTKLFLGHVQLGCAFDVLKGFGQLFVLEQVDSAVPLPVHGVLLLGVGYDVLHEYGLFGSDVTHLPTFFYAGPILLVILIYDELLQQVVVGLLLVAETIFIHV